MAATVNVSYRFPKDLKRQVDESAATEDTTPSALVIRLVNEGLKTSEHPGIVYRNGPTGRRAAVLGGPDVWEIVLGVRHAAGTGDTRIANAADEMELPEHLVRIAVEFYAAYADEIDKRIAANEDAADRVRRMTEERVRLLG
jgi:hypothetical protein